MTPTERRDLAIATANRQQPAVETAEALLLLPFLQRSELPGQFSRIKTLQRHLTGHTDALRQAEHDAILGATPADFLDLAAALNQALPQGPVVVLGPQAALLSALAAEPGRFVIRA